MNSLGVLRGTERYVFKARWKQGLMQGLDAVGAAIVWLATKGRGLQIRPGLLDDPKKILVIRLDHMGDLLFGRPCLQALRARYPNARITVLCSSLGAALLANDWFIDQRLAWDTPWFNRASHPPAPHGFWAMVKIIRKEHFDLVLDLRGDFRHHLLTWLAGVKVRVGYAITGGGFLLHSVLQLRPQVHEVERNLDVLRFLSAVNLPREYPRLKFEKKVAEWAQASWHQPRRRVLVHPGAGDHHKCWGADKFGLVCQTLVEQGFEIKLIGTQNEAGLARAVGLNSRKPVVDLAGKTTLPELTALISSADLVIGNDSGPVHLALTQGTPVIIIWSKTNSPVEWGPWGRQAQARVIEHPETTEAVSQVIQAAQELVGVSRLRRRKGAG